MYWTDLKAVLSILAIALGVLLFSVLCIWCIQAQEPAAARVCEEKLGGIWSCSEIPEDCACYREGKIVSTKEAP